MPTALVIRHEPYEAIAGFRAPIEARGFDIVEIDVGTPEFCQIDLLAPELLVIMGGPMGVYEQDRFPWLSREIVRVCERIAADLPTLGVCLGSQIMAAAMGARVFPGPVRELGFAPIELTADGRGSALSALAGIPMLHWHGDSFDLPEGTALLASTSLYRHQAFSRGPNILALQFHPEMGVDEDFESWLEQGQDFIAGAGTDTISLRSAYVDVGPACAAAGRQMLQHWLAGIDG